MKSIIANALFAAVLLINISCNKEAAAPGNSTDEENKSLPTDNNLKLNTTEAKLVGTWICTDFTTERYDSDTNYLVTCENMQGIRLRTYVFKPDKTCFTVDSFKYNYNPVFNGSWSSDGKYISIGEKKDPFREIIVKIDADSLVTTWGWLHAGSGDVYGWDLYKFKYKRVK